MDRLALGDVDEDRESVEHDGLFLATESVGSEADFLLDDGEDIVVGELFGEVGTSILAVDVRAMVADLLPELSVSEKLRNLYFAVVVVLGLAGIAWFAQNMHEILESFSESEFSTEEYSADQLEQLYYDWSKASVRQKTRVSSDHGYPSNVFLDQNGDPIIEDFEVLKHSELSEAQRRKLELLREYFELNTGVSVENYLFVFRGRGSTGINVRRELIGIHESVLEEGFDESLLTFTHEVGHNLFRDHKVATFMRMNETLHQAMRDKLLEIAKKAEAGEELTDDEKRILEIEDEWNSL